MQWASRDTQRQVIQALGLLDPEPEQEQEPEQEPEQELADEGMHLEEFPGELEQQQLRRTEEEQENQNGVDKRTGERRDMGGRGERIDDFAEFHEDRLRRAIVDILAKLSQPRQSAAEVVEE